MQPPNMMGFMGMPQMQMGMMQPPNMMAMMQQQAALAAASSHEAIADPDGGGVDLNDPIWQTKLSSSYLHWGGEA